MTIRPVLTWQVIMTIRPEDYAELNTDDSTDTVDSDDTAPRRGWQVYSLRPDDTDIVLWGIIRHEYDIILIVRYRHWTSGYW